MRELNDAELEAVSGGDGDLAMGFAGSWAGTVTSTAIGFTVGGPVGALFGALGGLALSGLVAVGYHLSTSEGGPGGGGGASSGSSGGTLQGSIDRTGGSRISESS